MGTSGARQQPVIAPASGRKTPAMRARTLAWIQDGGPGARPRPVRGRRRCSWRADRHPYRYNRHAHLVFAARRPARVGGRGRPVDVGDHQQLAAIGAGDVLRDIKQTHGALHLAELHRFTDPAEAAASLALRDGKPEALRFYLDHGRVHVGDLAKITDDAFVAWISDRAVGLDAIMLAPTRQLVAELNRRAREHRLGN